MDVENTKSLLDLLLLTTSRPGFVLRYGYAVIKFIGYKENYNKCPTDVDDLFTGSAPTIKLGVCIPNSCSDKEASKLVGLIMPQQSCGVISFDRNVHWTTGAIAMTTFVTVVAVLMFFGTLFDYFSHQKMLKKLEREPAQEYERNLGSFVKFWLAFSMYSNAKNVFNTTQKPGQIYSVHGIRLFSMMWVVIGHSYFSAFSTDNVLIPLTWIPQQLSSLIITNATFSVDSFFLLSGLLVSYLWFKEMQKNPWRVRNVQTWVMYYVHRYLRLTPVYAIIILAYLYLMPLFVQGTVKNPSEFQNCHKNWWTNMLYISNLVKQGEMCYGVSWYLSNDMQFYVLAPLILIPLFYFPIAGAVAGLCLLLTSFGINLYTTFHYHLSTGLINAPTDPVYKNISRTEGWDAAKEDINWNLNYVAPWIRFVPYEIGVFLGYIMARNKTVKIKKAISLLIWVVVWITALSLVFGLYENAKGNQLDLGVRMLYNCVSRPLWALCVGWVVFACHYGYGGWINEFLSWKGWIPFSRLTYCAYLLHMTLQTIIIVSSNQPLHWSGHFNWITEHSVPLLVITYAVSFVFTCAFEIPIMSLEKLILPQRRSANLQYVQHKTKNNAVLPHQNGDVIPSKY